MGGVVGDALRFKFDWRMIGATAVPNIFEKIMINPAREFPAACYIAIYSCREDGECRKTAREG